MVVWLPLSVVSKLDKCAEVNEIVPYFQCLLWSLIQSVAPAPALPVGKKNEQVKLIRKNKTNLPFPLVKSSKTGILGLSANASPWFTRASFTVSYPEITTTFLCPTWTLKTGPYILDSCQEKRAVIYNFNSLQRNSSTFPVLIIFQSCLWVTNMVDIFLTEGKDTWFKWWECARHRGG